jgi:multidrug/hemolysin transport system permease protein
MMGLGNLISRNSKLFFKDKAMFFTSLITPIILLILYTTFLGNVYKQSFLSAIPTGFDLPEKLINAVVAGQLVSSLLAVCCVTVSFCSNMLMVQDKVSGARADLTVTPVNKSTLAVSYYISTLISTLAICVAASVICFIYLSNIGWYLSFKETVLFLLDVILLVMFGTALSSIINFFLNSQGQISAVGTIVSAGYGFICGAYMPVSSFSAGLQKVISFLPGTYGTGLLRNHALNGVFSELSEMGMPKEFVTVFKDSIDCNLYFFDKCVSIEAMYAVLCCSVVVLVLAYIILNVAVKKR